MAELIKKLIKSNKNSIDIASEFTISELEKVINQTS